MEIRDQYWFGFAILVTLAFHIALIAPLSKWVNHQMIPQLNVESMVIDLTDKPIDKKKPKRLFVPEKEKVKKISEKEKTKTKEKMILPEKSKIFTPVEKIKKQLVEPQSRLQKRILKKKKALIGKKPESQKHQDRVPIEIPKEQKPASLTENKTKQVFKHKQIAKAIKPKSQKLEPKPPSQRPDNLQKKKVSKGKSPDKPLTDLGKNKTLDGLPEKDVIRSPLFKKKQIPFQQKVEKETEELAPEFPKDVKETLRGNQPEKTEDENLQYSMNTYEWTFERFVENWAIDIRKWWRGPIDYISGNVPEGGNIWIQVTLDKSGRLVAYKVLKSKVSAEMELMVIQALIGSLKRPILPGSFLEDMLVINWRFIYPPLRPEINLRR